ncbi:hypothetical protein YC2023_122253 [Brassica napus]
MHILKIPPHPVVGATRILSESLSIWVCFVVKFCVIGEANKVISLVENIQHFGEKKTIRVLCNKKSPNEEKSDMETYQNAQICYEGENMREDSVRRLPGNLT